MEPTLEMCFAGAAVIRQTTGKGNAPAAIARAVFKRMIDAAPDNVREALERAFSERSNPVT